MLTKLVQRVFHHDPDLEGMTEEGLVALSELNAYCEDIVKARRRASPDTADAIDAVVRFESGGHGLSDADAGSHVGMLVIGGSETFPKVFSSGLLRLWGASGPACAPRCRSEQCGRCLQRDPALRHADPVPGPYGGQRSLELHGQELRAGQPVIFLYASANRDEREFDDPDVFDIARKPARILTFGAGNHACLGTHVARMEGRVCLQAILERFPEYDLDLDHAVRFKTEFVQGFASLPLRTC